MKKTSILFLALFLLLPVAGWTSGYVLVMSKEDNVCQHMLKIYNADLKKYGEVRYDEHEEFTAIKWEDQKYYRVHDKVTPIVKTENRVVFGVDLPALV